MEVFRRYLGEAIGTAALVFIGAGAVMANVLTNGSVGIVGVALAFGFVILAMVYIFGPISGAHINPAITIAFWATGKTSLQDAIGYILFQLLGAFVAALALLLTFGDLVDVGAGVTVLAEGVTTGQGVFIEAVLTFFLMLAVLAFVQKKSSDFFHGGTVIGLVIAMDILLGFGLTGGSMNPARTFGPAIVANLFTDHWVYWVGPIVGAVAAAFLWRWFYEKQKE